MAGRRRLLRRSQIVGPGAEQPSRAAAAAPAAVEAPKHIWERDACCGGYFAAIGGPALLLQRMPSAAGPLHVRLGHYDRLVDPTAPQNGRGIAILPRFRT